MRERDDAESFGSDADATPAPGAEDSTERTQMGETPDETPAHKHPDDDEVTESSEESFPASDPPAWSRNSLT